MQMAAVHCFLIIGLLLCFVSSPAFAKGRSIVIDARKGMTRALYEDYKRAVLGEGRSRSVRHQIILHISARHGFDAGFLEVPRHIRRLNTRVVIYVHHGNIIAAPLSINLLTLDRRQIFNINQRLIIR